MEQDRATPRIAVCDTPQTLSPGGLQARRRVMPYVVSVLALSASMHVACGDSSSAPNDPVPSTVTTGGVGGTGGEGGEGGATPTQDCEALAAAAQAALDASLVAEQEAEPDRVGGTVAAVISRDCQWAGSTGNANAPARADATPLEPDGLLALASVTKTYTAAMIMLAVEDGLLGLDDTLATYIVTGVPNEDTITIRQLLNHTAGVANYYDDDDFLQRTLTRPNSPVTPQQLVDVAIGLGPAFEPGMDWAYSNTHFILLGMVLEEVFGDDLATVYRQRLFEPHDLTRTFFYGERLPEPITRGFFGTSDTTGVPHPSVSWSSGGMVADVTDVTRWIRAFVSGDVLTEASTAEIQQWYNVGNDVRYGLGLLWYRDPRVGLSIGHDGARPGYEAEVYHLPDQDLTVGILTNNRVSDDYVVWQTITSVAVEALAEPER
ncbi:MAG: serine hydrolase domain-containing protein [Myxococcota bacterium]